MVLYKKNNIKPDYITNLGVHKNIGILIDIAA